MLATRSGTWSPTLQPWWEDLKRGVSRLASLDKVKQAHPLSRTYLLELLNHLIKSNQRELAALFSLAWLLAGRLGEVIIIPRAHIRLKHSPITVKFSYLKGVFGRQEKILPPGPLCDIVTNWAKLLDNQNVRRTRLFHIPLEKAKVVLRNHDPALSGHSFRRGALQHANEHGAKGEDLRVLSGHKSEAVLQRYLGMASSERRDAMLRAGQALKA